MSIFRRNKEKANKSIKKMDAIITGLVLGGIVASVYGIKKHEHDKTPKEKEPLEERNKDGKMSYGAILKALIFGFKEEKVEKQSFFSKIISLFKLRGKK